MRLENRLVIKGPGIIRKQSVEMCGPKRLDAAAATATSEPVAEVAARIVEQHDDFAVIEVTCSCGRTVQIRCGYEQATG